MDSKLEHPFIDHHAVFEATLSTKPARLLPKGLIDIDKHVKVEKLILVDRAVGEIPPRFILEKPKQLVAKHMAG